MTLPTALDVYQARRRIAPHVRRTPLIGSAWLSSVADATVSLKLESLQETGSFKFRGAMNAVLRLTEGGQLEGVAAVVTASAGNHGRALALAAERVGVRAVVFTPATAPEVKKVAIRRHGADLMDDALDYDAAEASAREFAQSEGLLYVSPYNHPDVIAGAGTVALEVVEEQPAVDAVLVPIGGGGLASGVGLAIRAAAPRAEIIAVEVAASTAFSSGLAEGRIVEVPVTHTLADGLAGNLEPDSMTFGLVQRLVDRVATVSEDELTRAMRGLASEERLITEGAGAAAVAAVLSGDVIRPGQRAVVLVTGSNIDLAAFAPLLAG
ncbi:MAG: threonine/serine dehydratase [Acidobacteriota bacterium]